MQELVGRLTELDPDAGAAVKVIAYFDRLVEGRAGLEPIVRGAAVLAGCAARLVDEQRGARIRVDANGHVLGGLEMPGPDWPSAPLYPDGPPQLWLERPGPPDPVAAMVLERAVGAARAVFERTRGLATGHDPVSVNVLVDATIGEATRRLAARKLGVPVDMPVRVVIPHGGRLRIESATGRAWPAPTSWSGTERAGIGPLVDLLDLPESSAAARTALRLTAAGTEVDPGPRVVRAEELGGIAMLATVIGPETEPSADVIALRKARTAAPWVLATLEAVANSPSVRTAATVLTVHHSTLQERLGHVENMLGWSVRNPQGKLRLHLALTMHRLHDQP
jgi:hypothetical protein